LGAWVTWARRAVAPPLPHLRLHRAPGERTDAQPWGQIVTRRARPPPPFQAKLIPGPPKRFAQGIGAVFTAAATIPLVRLGAGAARPHPGSPLMGVAATLESVFAFCLAARSSDPMRGGIIPPTSASLRKLHRARLAQLEPQRSSPSGADQAVPVMLWERLVEAKPTWSTGGGRQSQAAPSRRAGRPGSDQHSPAPGWLYGGSADR